MTMRAQYLGAAGTIIDGKLRDLQEHRELEYPVSCDPLTQIEHRLLLTDGTECCERSLLAMLAQQRRRRLLVLVR